MNLSCGASNSTSKPTLQTRKVLMTNSRHFWLGAAALLATSGVGAQAADLPFRKAAPVEYVRVCDAFGQGFFYIPGSDTCLKIGGQLRGEETFRGKAPTNFPTASAYNLAGQVYKRDLTSFRVRAYLNLDARTQTAYGTLRSFISLRFARDSTGVGPIGGRGELGVAGVPAGVRASTGFFQGFDPGGNQPLVDKAFIQFAGITAGRAQSFFDFDAQSYELLTASLANSDELTQLLAYTATFGGGFSATVSVEDPNQRRIADNGLFVFSSTNPYATTVTAGNINSPIFNTATGVRTAGIFAYGGDRVPDVVANIRYDGGWGSAQLSGAYHQLNSVAVAPLSGKTAATYVQGPTQTLSGDGFAVSGGVKVLLPMLAKGDSITLQGTYERGAMDYVNPENYYNGIANIYAASTTGVGQSIGLPVNDAFYVTRANGSVAISTNSGYGGFAAFRHYFVPDVSGTVFGDYLQIDNPVQAQRLGSGNDSARIWQIGGNVIWTPVKDLQIGAEVVYSDMLFASSSTGLCFGNVTCNTAAGGVSHGTTPQNPDDYRARFSIRRAF